MSEQIARCQACIDQPEPRKHAVFTVPWGDRIGPALMEEHYRETHPEIFKRVIVGRSERSE